MKVVIYGSKDVFRFVNIHFIGSTVIPHYFTTLPTSPHYLFYFFAVTLTLWLPNQFLYRDAITYSLIPYFGLSGLNRHNIETTFYKKIIWFQINQHEVDAIKIPQMCCAISSATFRVFFEETVNMSEYDTLSILLQLTALLLLVNIQIFTLNSTVVQ